MSAEVLDFHHGRDEVQMVRRVVLGIEHRAGVHGAEIVHHGLDATPSAVGC